jgi:hypothetical protein
MQHFMSFRSFFKDIVVPPYRFLPLAVFAFAVLCFVLHPASAIRTGYLADPDDYMRLNQVINWLRGQGWYDLSHPRLSPGAHTIVHWARLMDLPLAVLMLPFVSVLGVQGAALAASFIVPPLLLGVLLWLLPKLALPFVGADRANLSTLFVLFAPLVVMNYAPGRVDHHGYQILVAMFGLLSLERIVEDRQHGDRYAVMAAVVFACGLWSGTEASPWVVLFIGCLTSLAAWHGGVVLKRAAMFGIAFTAATLMVLYLGVEPDERSSLALSWYSAADVVFAVLVCIVLLAGWVVGRGIQNKWMRLAAFFELGSMAAVLLYFVVPEILRGPFANYDIFDSTVALASIGEAQPLLRTLHFSSYHLLQTGASLLGILQMLLLPLLALVAVCTAAIQTAPPKRLLFLAHALFLTAAIGMTLFWQLRVGWFMQIFTVAPLTWLLLRGWDKISRHMSGIELGLAKGFIFLLLGFVPVVLIPAVVHNAPLVSDVVLFPAKRPQQACPMRPVADFLNLDSGYGAAPHTILSGSNEGPELLFRTQHNVIAANFNVVGNADVYAFFGAREDAVARKVAVKWHTDLVLICRSFPLAYARLDHTQPGRTAFLAAGSDGKLHLTGDPEHPTLIERLVWGPVPAWLKPVEIPDDKDYLLFEVLQ